MLKVLILLTILCQFTEYGAARHRRRFSHRRHAFRRDEELTTPADPIEDVGEETEGPVTNEPEEGIGDEQETNLPEGEPDEVTSVPEEGNDEQEPTAPAVEEGGITVVPNEEEESEFAKVHGLSEYPFIVSVVNKVGQQIFCGGVIFSHKHVITAAHCICNWNGPRNPTTLEIETITDMPATDKYPVQEILCHPDYNKKSEHIHNVGILSVTTAFKFNDRVSHYQFDFENPDDLKSETDFDLVDIIWSIIATRRNNDIHMEDVVLRRTDNRVCEFTAYPMKKKIPGVTKLNEWDICVIEQQGSCNAVPGCPIMNNRKLVGIVSRKMCNKKLKGVYSFIDLPNHFDWIKTTMHSISGDHNHHRRRRHKN